MLGIILKKYSGPKLLIASKVYQVIFPFYSHMGDEGVIYRTQLFDPIENDLTFYPRQNLARYDEPLKFYVILSKIHHFQLAENLMYFWLLYTMVISNKA